MEIFVAEPLHTETFAGEDAPGVGLTVTLTVLSKLTQLPVVDVAVMEY